MNLRHCLAVTALLILPVTAQAADVNTGRQLAQRWCATCHLVTPEQTRANADVPAFAAVAARPGFDEHKLAFFLLDPHPKMPNMGLTRTEAGDLAAYIASLRK
jgi:mono/diheme cytochrome c family protein